ncbi:Methyl-accepting chemotaxis protein I (serine chemoreceptor protein) [hydrothermal vent metagenome]|uniref:Methyl-accepting chemotaxis protein I (Serine chemoreceptor protein) n=1 Tax=hydrothermal vent metagenome TaxID=652676 RepID=A0A3B1A391_9ZZZZ
MATKKPKKPNTRTKSAKPKKLGFDPLSWMKEYAGDDPSIDDLAGNGSVLESKTEVPSSIERNKASDKVSSKKHPLGLNVAVLESSFAAVAPNAEQLVALFYKKLFNAHPELKPLFENTTAKQQETKLLSALKIVMANLNNVDTLAKTLTNLGEKHQTYGVVEAHYPVVRDTLLSALQEISGDSWTQSVYTAWFDALNVIAKVMTNAYSENVVDIHVVGTDEDDYISPFGLDVKTLESSFNLLAPKAEALVTRFYEELFKRYPGVIPLFKNTTQAKQQIKLLGALKLVVANLRKPDILAPALAEMGQRHQAYGAEPAHYDAVRDTLLGVMQEFAGSAWNSTIETAWRQALNLIAKVMTDAYSNTEDNTMSTNVTDMGAGLSNDERSELTRLRSAVSGAMQPIMMIDRDFNITYANQATIDMLIKHEAMIAQVFPGFRASTIIGSCIDQFHKNPSHQRNMLSDPKNLPYSTNIEVGPLNFKLNVTAMIDAEGHYLGNTLEWSDITDALVKDNQAIKLQGAMDGSMQASIMIDRDLIITYANKATIDLLTKYQTQLASVYPGFDPSKIVGTCIDTFHKDPAMQRRMLSDPNNLPHQADIQVGSLKFSLNVTAIKDVDGNYVGNALEWSDVTEQRQKEQEVARLQSAVDGAQTNIMICDADLIITYANPAVVTMMSNRAEKLRAMFPGFDPNNLVGQCIDQFHKNPAHQRSLLGKAENLPASAEIKLGDVEFNVNATAVTDSEGILMGNMVEWRDITEQKDAERQIQSLIESAVSGDLDARINAESYQGFLKDLAAGINELMEAVVVPLREGQKVVQALAEGTLTETMDGEFQGEFGDLRDAMNTSVTNLLNMVNQIRDSADSIGSSSSEIAEGNANLSQRTEEQASSLEETASSMEEMTSTVKQNADNAREANQLALAASTQAQSGGEVVSKAVEAMSEINNSSKKIADIIGVIDEIAFQTNLLALNAAVEAARAGEQGRGFAVVAGEVRNLAQRSAGAAKEIKGLINDSVEKVDDGSRLVDETGKTLEEIVNAVKKVSDIISEIAAASQEQSSGIEEVNRAITQMDEMTQQNAALVEEAAAAGEAMNEQAGGLNELMNFFDVGDASSLQPEAAAAVRPASQQRAAPERAAVKRQAAPAAARKRPAAKDEGDEWEDF